MFRFGGSWARGGGGVGETDGVSCLLKTFLGGAETMLSGLRRGEREDKMAERATMIYTDRSRKGRRHVHTVVNLSLLGPSSASDRPLYSIIVNEQNRRGCAKIYYCYFYYHGGDGKATPSLSRQLTVPGQGVWTSVY